MRPIEILNAIESFYLNKKNPEKAAKQCGLEIVKIVNLINKFEAKIREFNDIKARKQEAGEDPEDE